MVDTIRPKENVLALLADNTDGQISAQDLRDAIVSLYAVAARVPYAHHSGLPALSVSGIQAPAVADAFLVSFYGSDRQVGSGALWLCIATSGTSGSPGDINYVAGQGLVLTGANGAGYRLVPGPGNIVDIRAANIRCDGQTTGQMSRLARCVSAARNQNWMLVNTSHGGKAQESAANRGNAFKATETVDLLGCNCDLVIQAGDQGDVTGAVPFYTGVESGMTTRPIAGVTKAIAVRAGGNLNNRQRLVQRLWVQGDGIFNNPNLASVIGIQLENMDSGLTDIHCTTAYCAAGVCIIGPQEKHRIRTRHQYDNYAVYVPSGSSADTIVVEVDGQNCWSFVWEEDNVDTSIHYDLNCEAGNDTGDSRPAIKIANGKHSILSGKYRGHNGNRPAVLVDKASSYGVDSLTFKDLTFIHSGGANSPAVQIDRCRVVDGHFTVKDWTGGAGAPTVWLKRIKAAGALTFSMRQIGTREGVRIGDVANNWFPDDCDFGGFSVEMGNGSVGSYPTSAVALVIEKMNGGSITPTQLQGQVSLEADAVGVDVNLPKDVRRYALNRSDGGTCVVRYGGLVQPVAETTNRSLTVNESGNHYTNAGAEGAIAFTLPAAAAGLEYTFTLLAEEDMTITAAGGDNIIAGAVQAIDGGSIICKGTLGASITLKCFDATNWIATALVETGMWALPE